MKHLAIVGGGFAGLWAALAAAREFSLAAETCRITLVARDEFLTIRPRLYETFTPAMRVPLAPVLAAVDIELLVGEVTHIDSMNHRLQVVTSDGVARGAHFDRLVLATGSRQRPLPVPGATAHTFNIDTFESAARLDAHLRVQVTARDSAADRTFVIIGGGFTGIELATGMRARLHAHAEAASAKDARVILIERASAIGPSFGEAPRPHLMEALSTSGVELCLGREIREVTPHGVVFEDGEHIAARTVIVTSGLEASPLGATLGVPCDALGRVEVDENLRVHGLETTFAAGDCAHARVDDTHWALMSCQHAIPMGKHAGHNAARDLLGLGLALRPYRQPDYVTCLDLGDYGALLTTGWDRDPIQWGADVKALKHTINTQWIYPPRPARTEILAAANLDAPWPPPA